MMMVFLLARSNFFLLKNGICIFCILMKMFFFRGLGVETVFLNLIKIYCDPGNLVFIIGTTAEEENYIISELTSQEVVHVPKIITAEKSIAERLLLFTLFSNISRNKYQSTVLQGNYLYGRRSSIYFHSNYSSRFIETSYSYQTYHRISSLSSP